jgi:ribonuclease P protein component
MFTTGRLTRREDFERLLAVRPSARTAHFIVHHLAEPAVCVAITGAVVTAQCSHEADAVKLSTGAAPKLTASVDKSSGKVCVGCVVPKRHARRAVTRNLLRRQIHAAVRRHRARMAAGHWVVRLRSGFDRDGYISAASEALRSAVRSELDMLLTRAT